MEFGKIYISSPIDNEIIYLSDIPRDVLGFKNNIINGENVGAVSGFNRVISADYPHGLSLDSCIFAHASFVETSRFGNSNVPLLRVLE